MRALIRSENSRPPKPLSLQEIQLLKMICRLFGLSRPSHELARQLLDVWCECARNYYHRADVGIETGKAGI
jgi:hypothetical protein